MELERWSKLDKRQQLLNIKTELFRATNWQHKDTEKFQGSLIRALDLIATTFNDKKWKNELIQLIILYEEVAKIFINKTNDIKIIFNAI